MSDKRHFHRIKLNIPGELCHDNDAIAVTVKDISLKGIRLHASEVELEKLPFDSHRPYHVTFQVNEDSPAIELDLEQLYRQTDSNPDSVFLGCRVASPSIENVAMLRRLIELNSEHPELSDKEIDAIIDAIVEL